MTLRVHPDQIIQESNAGLLAIHPSWERVRLGDVATVQNGFAFKSEHFDRNRGVPLLRIRDVGRNSTETRYTGEFDPAYIVRRGDIIVGMDGDFRVARWAGDDALLNQRVCRVTVQNPDLFNPDFLFYALPGYLEAVHAHTSSVTVKHLSSRTVMDLPLPLPPRAEQRRIVAAIEEQFSRLDDADQSLEDAERRADRMRSAVGAHAVVGGLPEVPLGDLTDAMRYGTSVKCRVDADGPPVLRIPNIRRGRVDPTDLKFATVERSSLGDCFVEQGDLLFVRTNGSRDLIGRVAVVEDDTRPAFASYLIRARPNRALVDPEWLVLALSTPAARALIESRAATSAGQYNLNLQSLRSLPVPVLPLEEQRRRITAAAAELSRLDAVVASIAAARRRSAALRRSILERAFRGELVPQDPSDEPASVLLERIRAERAAAGASRRRSSRRTARSGHAAGTSGR